MPLKSRKFRWLLRAGFVVALAATLFFGVRTALSAFYWSNPNHADQVIEGWMPLGYVGRSWDVPREVIGDAAGLQPGVRSRFRPGRNIEDIAQQRGIPLDALIAQIMSAIDLYRESLND